MKVGGNASFADFLVRHPGSHSYGSSDIKDKYSSRAAVLYKEELQKRVLADEQQFGKGKVHVDGVATDKAAPTKNDADFFDTWDAPPAARTPSATPSANSPLISFGLSPGNTPLSSRPTTPRVPSAAPTPAPAVARTVTSSSLRTGTTGSTTSTARPKATLGARTTSSLGATAGRGKLGVKKGGVVNFEEAERKAKEDEERIKRLGYDSRKEQEAAAAAAAIKPSSSSTAASGSMNGKAHAKKESVDTERLGMGIKRLGFGQTTGMSGEEAAKEAAAAAKAATRRANGYDDEPGARIFFAFH